MPQVIETTIEGYVSCPDPRCPGYQEERMPVLRREALYMREEFGGDIPGVDHSTVTVPDETAIDPATGELRIPPCPHCGKHRLASEGPRPEYAPISGQDPLALLSLDKQKQVNELALADANQRAEVAELRAQMAQMSALLESQQAELQRRRGGRPPKQEDGGE